MDIKELFGLTGKNVVITGAASGMGRAATELLIGLGANVYAVDINPIDLPVTKAYQANLGDFEEIKKLVDELPNEIEAFYSCQGISHFPGREITVSKVNFLGHRFMTELLLPKINDMGSVTYISSVGGFGWEQNYKNCLEYIAQPTWDDSIKWLEEHSYLIKTPEGQPDGALDYTFAKQSLCSYVNSKAHDPMFISRKIRINCICPGDTLTGLTDDFNKSTGNGDAKAGEKAIEQIFLASWNGHMAMPKEMGYPLVTLGSKISSYISGQKIYIDYGLTSTWLHGGLLSQTSKTIQEQSEEAQI
ncbi:MAG: SDR family oxidoreductase [Traorella sp.]